MRIFVFALALLVANTIPAADIVGEVTVLKKGRERPLKNRANAVIYLEGMKTAAPAKVVVLNQTKKRFTPRLLAVVKGQEVQFLNSDRVQHNVFSRHNEEPFDLGRYPRPQHKSVKFKTLGPHKVYCNIHQRMIADVFVLENDYFTLTDEMGRFKIRDVPKGDYKIKAWHIFGGTAEKQIQVANKQMSLNFTLKSQKYIRQVKIHKNKFGEAYKIGHESEGGGGGGGY